MYFKHFWVSVDGRRRSCCKIRGNIRHRQRKVFGCDTIENVMIHEGNRINSDVVKETSQTKVLPQILSNTWWMCAEGQIKLFTLISCWLCACRVPRVLVASHSGSLLGWRTRLKWLKGNKVNKCVYVCLTERKAQSLLYFGKFSWTVRRCGEKEGNVLQRQTLSNLTNLARPSAADRLPKYSRAEQSQKRENLRNALRRFYLFFIFLRNCWKGYDWIRKSELEKRTFFYN